MAEGRNGFRRVSKYVSFVTLRGMRVNVLAKFLVFQAYCVMKNSKQVRIGT